MKKMTGKVIFSLILIATLVSCASLPVLAQGNAQDTQTKPVATVRQNVLSLGTPATLKEPWQHQQALPSVPNDCSGNGGGCLYYGGDFNYDNPNANGVSNETDIAVPAGGTTPKYGAAVYSNFQVPTGQTWNVTGLLVNVLSVTGGGSPELAYWEIRQGVSSGNGGTLVASGTGPDSFKPTGRHGIALNEYTVKVYIPAGVILSSGTYFMIVVPQCITSNQNCPAARYFITDVEDIPPMNGRGSQLWDDAFFNSGFFGANFEPTWGSTGACGGLGCNRFSAGVIGTK
jgi:hypothetical protein